MCAPKMFSLKPNLVPILQPAPWPQLNRLGVQLAVLRLDQVDPLLSGNKWYKLQPFLQAVQQGRASGLISLGGAHSNHLHALAAAGKRYHFPTVGLLRGHAQYTPTVHDLRSCGMSLHWLGYAGYRERHLQAFWQPWQAQYPGFLALPEGGASLDAAKACASIVQRLPSQLPLNWSDYDQLWIAAGTGTTLAGFILGEAGRHPVVGALAVPPNHGTLETVQQLLAEAGCVSAAWHCVDASLGAFARIDVELARCMRDFEQSTRIPLEPLYTGKLVLALLHAAQRGELSVGSRIIMVHSGGLQGRRALERRLQQLRTA